MPFVFAVGVAAFLLGLLLGSFLNVCISRLPEHQSIAHPRSRCPHCGHVIRWYDNVPLLSWILLRGRCRDCGEPISWRYPAVELATGLWFAFCVLLGLHTPPGSVAAPLTFENITLLVLGTTGLAVLGFLLLGLLVMDWRTRRLPDAFTLTGALVGFCLLCAQAAFIPTGAGDIKLNPRHNLRMSSPGSFAARGNVFLTGTEGVVMGRVVAIAGAALLMLSIRWLYFALRGRKRLPRPDRGETDHRFGLGLGDVKLLALIAAFLGFWPSLLALLLGSVAASLYAVVLLARGRAHAVTALPFGSFLCAGGLLAAAAGGPILAWYSSFLR